MDYETRVQQAATNLDSVYKPQTDFYNKQMTDLPGVYDLQRNQADQARVNAFRQIEQTANSRGMFFSGQPIQKQLEYNFGTFDPTMARINSEQQNRKTQLEQALLTLNLNKNKQARTWVDAQIKAEQEAAAREQARQDAERRHQENLRASYARTRAASARAAAAKAPNMFVKSDRSGGFGFTDYKGNPISAAMYAKQTGTDIRDLLKYMGSQGDQYAGQVYNQLVLDPNPARNETQYKRLYSALFWGT